MRKKKLFPLSYSLRVKDNTLLALMIPSVHCKSMNIVALLVVFALSLMTPLSAASWLQLPGNF